METNSPQQSQDWLDQEKELIDTFFNLKVSTALSDASESSACTPATCIDFARRLLNADDIRPVDNQGMNSYTLVSPSQQKIVQFRMKRLDDEIQKLVQSTYKGLVPEPVLVEGFPLPVYVYPKEFPLQRQLLTVRYLAAFIAWSAWRPQWGYKYLDRSWTAGAEAKLEDLAAMENLRRIEPRFAQKAEELLEKIDLLELLPPVLTHVDFAGVNLLVDPISGQLTGVLDFDDARIEAFGMCIFGVYEGFFGVMRHGRWSYFDQPAPEVESEPKWKGKSVRQILERHFWSILWKTAPVWMKKSEYKEAVHVALDVGIIYRYFNWEGDVDTENEDHMRSVNWATGLLLDR